jgi:hypothetical protein
MWQVKTNTDFSAQGYFIRDRAGAEHWVAALRASFSINAGGLVKIAETQDPVLLAPVYADDEAGELKSESDIAPFRPKPDFVLCGMACLADMAAARALEASLSIGAMTKRAAVTCPRILRKRDGALSVEQGDPFGGIELTWRNSLGGADLLPKPGEEAQTQWANPVGRGWTKRWRDLPDGADIMLPMIENASDRIQPGRPLPAPFGFGAVQPHWLPRRQYAGTYGDAWQKGRAPLLPDDFDDRFYQSAPADQQLDLKGGEQVSAVNLHPDGAFSFRLPQIILEASTRIGREKHETRLRLISVELDTAAKSLAMVWNTLVPCNGRDTEVEGSMVRMKQMAGVTG